VNDLYLHLGSNEGDRISFLKKALSLISEHVGLISQQSMIYETSAWGMTDQPDFLNMAIEVKTKLSPDQVLNACQQIESNVGKKKEVKWGPREIDIDILLYNNIILDHKELKIPHPHLEKRNFVLIPLMEIAGLTIHPSLNKTIEELYEENDDECEVWIFEEK
jgi:2-amino-4-hydroxy-6-hydroxymethyldihydropteridine diphosphokinase